VIRANVFTRVIGFNRSARSSLGQPQMSRCLRRYVSSFRSDVEINSGPIKRESLPSVFNAGANSSESVTTIAPRIPPRNRSNSTRTADEKPGSSLERKSRCFAIVRVGDPTKLRSGRDSSRRSWRMIHSDDTRIHGYVQLWR